MANYEWLEKIIFSREYRIASETLALGSNSSQDPRFLLTLAAPLKMICIKILKCILSIRCVWWLLSIELFFC